MIEFEQQDYETAKEIIGKKFLMGVNKQTLDPTEENIVDVAKKYYTLRMRTYDPRTGDHL